jgi:hypothetical protein
VRHAGSRGKEGGSGFLEKREKVELPASLAASAHSTAIFHLLHAPSMSQYAHLVPQLSSADPRTKISALTALHASVRVLPRAQYVNIVETPGLLNAIGVNFLAPDKLGSPSSFSALELLQKLATIKQWTAKTREESLCAVGIFKSSVFGAIVNSPLRRPSEKELWLLVTGILEVLSNFVSAKDLFCTPGVSGVLTFGLTSKEKLITNNSINAIASITEHFSFDGNAYPDLIRSVVTRMHEEGIGKRFKRSCWILLNLTKNDSAYAAKLLEDFPTIPSVVEATMRGVRNNEYTRTALAAGNKLILKLNHQRDIRAKLHPAKPAAAEESSKRPSTVDAQAQLIEELKATFGAQQEKLKTQQEKLVILERVATNLQQENARQKKQITSFEKDSTEEKIAKLEGDNTRLQRELTAEKRKTEAAVNIALQQSAANLDMSAAAASQQPPVKVKIEHGLESDEGSVGKKRKGSQQ